MAKLRRAIKAFLKGVKEGYHRRRDEREKKKREEKTFFDEAELPPAKHCPNNCKHCVVEELVDDRGIPRFPVLH